MQRKIIATCAALVALGALAVVPAVSSAARLVDGANTTPTSGNIVAYNETGQALKVSSGLAFECNEVTMTGPVHNNGVSGGQITWTITHTYVRGSQAETKCSSSFGNLTFTVPNLTSAGGTTHWCLETLSGQDRFLITPDGCTTSPAGHVFRFTTHTGGMTCGFQRTAAIAGSFTTGAHGTAVTLTMDNGQEFKTEAVAGHSLFCPASVKFENFKFELFTDTDVVPGAYHHAASVADPLWIVNP